METDYVKVKFFRLLKGLSQKEIAYELGMTQSAWSKHENQNREMKKRDSNNLSIRKKLATLFELEEEDLYTDENIDYKKAKEEFENFMDSIPSYGESRKTDLMNFVLSLAISEMVNNLISFVENER